VKSLYATHPPPLLALEDGLEDGLADTLDEGLELIEAETEDEAEEDGEAETEEEGDPEALAALSVYLQRVFPVELSETKIRSKVEGMKHKPSALFPGPAIYETIFPE
jgi:hypothetical protein